MKKRKASPKFYYKPILGLVVFLVILVFLLAYIAQAAKKSEFFVIKDIIVREGFEVKDHINTSANDNSIDLSYLRGRNLFTVDLNQQEQFLSQIYPGYKKIRIVRVLPDRLFADFLRRKPIAYVKLYRNFSVDEEGVLFFLKETDEQLGLPEISGLEARIFGAKSGRKYNVKDLNLAVTIIKLTRNNKILKNFKISKINVSNPANPVFNILVGSSTTEAVKSIEIKLGQDYILDKINILGSLFAQISNDLGNIEYIDLRFKEPVIKFISKK